MESDKLKEIQELAKEAVKSIPSQKDYTQEQVKHMFSLLRGLSVACMDRLDVRSELKTVLPALKLGAFYDASRAIHDTSSFSYDRASIVRSNLNTVISIIEEAINNKKQGLSENPVIFYSWQSDLPNSTNRGFIKDSIEKAVKLLKNEVSVEARIESDTSGVTGSPDIVNTILSKINNSDIFVADISIVTQTKERSTPNPNVLFELGYAMKALGDKRVIMIFNDSYGDTGDLPFDLGFKRQLVYSLAEGDEKVEARKQIVKSLASAFKDIINDNQIR